MDDETPDSVEQRVAAAETAVAELAANQQRISQYVTRRLFMIDELTDDIRRALGIGVAE